MADSKNKNEKKKDGAVTAISQNNGRDRSKKIIKRGVALIIVSVVAFVLISAVVSIFSAIGEWISPKAKTPSTYPTVTVKYADTLFIPDGRYVQIDTSLSGVILVPARRHVHFKPITWTAYEIYGKGWKEPLIDYPTGEEYNPVGFWPTEYRLKTVLGRGNVTGTVLVTVTP